MLFTEYHTDTDWQSSSVKCKSAHNSYLFGDVDLTDPEQACNLIQNQPVGPSWLGIAREIYISINGCKYQQKMLLISYITAIYLRNYLRSIIAYKTIKLIVLEH